MSGWTMFSFEDAYTTKHYLETVVTGTVKRGIVQERIVVFDYDRRPAGLSEIWLGERELQYLLAVVQGKIKP